MRRLEVMHRIGAWGLALVSLAAVGLVVATCAPADAGPGAEAAGDLIVRRDTFRHRYLLTGELQAAEAVSLTVPRSPTWQVQIRWMEEDGAEVAEGQKVVEFDNSSVTANLEDSRLAAVEAANALERARSAAVTAVSDKEFALEQRRADLDKARIKAAVPVELLSGRDYQERQTALVRAEKELEKAREDLESTRRGQELEVRMQEIELTRAKREIEVAEEAIRTLSLRAPASGVLVISDHPWEGRKLQIGDTVWVGMPVAQIPDLTTLRVEAVLLDVDEGRIRSGMQALSTPDAFPDQHFPGRVQEVAPVAREVERSALRRFFRVTVDLDRVDPERMRPGMSMKVEIEDEGVEDVLVVPRRALDLRAEPPRVLLDGGGTRSVRLGECNPTHCVVEEGLEEGERLTTVPVSGGGEA